MASPVCTLPSTRTAAPSGGALAPVIRSGFLGLRPQRAGRDHLALMIARSAASILRTASPRRVCSSMSRLFFAVRPSSVSARPSASRVFISRSIASHSVFQSSKLPSKLAQKASSFGRPNLATPFPSLETDPVPLPCTAPSIGCCGAPSRPAVTATCVPS